MLDWWNVCVRHADRASHNPPAASSAAVARKSCFAFIVCLFFDSSYHIHFRYGIMRGFLGDGFRFGTKAGNSGAKRQRAGMNLILGLPEAQTRRYRKLDREANPDIAR